MGGRSCGSVMTPPCAWYSAPPVQGSFILQEHARQRTAIRRRVSPVRAVAAAQPPALYEAALPTCGWTFAATYGQVTFLASPRRRACRSRWWRTSASGCAAGRDPDTNVKIVNGIGALVVVEELGTAVAEAQHDEYRRSLDLRRDPAAVVWAGWAADSRASTSTSRVADRQRIP